jgi:hypothetical protein
MADVPSESKKRKRAHDITFLSVPFPLTNLEQISRLNKIQYGGHATEGYLDAILLIRRFNHSKMADTRTSEMVTVEHSNF